MKKLLIIIAMAVGVTFGSHAQLFQTRSFLGDVVAGYSSNGTNNWGGITISNAASAPLGGFTNILSWNNSTTAPLVQGTNCPRLTWTNNNGIWVIPTNGTPGTLSGVSFVAGPDATQLVRDLGLWSTSIGGIPVQFFGMYTNADTTKLGAVLDANSISPITLTCRFAGDTGAATALNLVFIGLPDGVNEATSVAGSNRPEFTWGLTPISGANVACTNLPLWRFVGCSKIRLKSATLTTATAANIGVTIQSLTMSGPIP